jgi:two-component system response regulator YesN
MEKGTKCKNITDAVLGYIMRLPDEEFRGLTIKTLAAHFAVSRCHLSRVFHAVRGMTLNTFIKRQRLLRAEHMLNDDGFQTVKDLASRLGYSDYQYFISSFKEQWGESPGRYRKLMR